MSANTMPARELIVAALAQATTPLTVTELAEEAGVAKSTAGKYLPALEKDGAAVRTPGGRQGRRRLPDHWQAAPTTPTEHGTADESPIPQTDSEPDRAEPEPSGATHPGHGQAGPAPVQAGADGTGHAPSAEEAVPGGTNGTGTGPVGDTPPPATAAPRADTRHPASGPDDPGADEEGLNPVSGSVKLAQGELKTMVWAQLKADPGAEFTATALSHRLQGRSVGAIQNNLAKLAREGKAELACDRPRRYRFAAQAH